MSLSDPSARPRGIAYVVGLYPALSLTFIQREVEALRARGLPIHTVSIREARDEHLLSEANRAAYESTYTVLPPGRELITAHLAAALRHPLAYGRTLRLAARLSPGGLRGLLWQLFYFAEAVVVWRKCLDWGVSHLHAHLANVSADVALLAAHLGGAADKGGHWSWSFTMHGPTEFYEVSRHRLPEKVRRASFVVCISDFAQSQLMGFVEPSHWPKLHVVHCGVDGREFAPRSEASESGGPPLILNVGRLVPEKGHAVLVEAIGRLRSQGAPVRCVIVGTGPEHERLRRQIEELHLDGIVSLAGAVGQDEIRRFYESAVAFCSPSFAEGIPVVLMEAMAMQLPVVATRVMGVPELVEDGVSGYVVPPGRADALARACGDLVASAELRAQMGAAGRAKVLREFDIDDSAARLFGLFDAVLHPETGT